MIGYWFYKFVFEDGDVSLIDYKSLKNGRDVALPVTSTCFKNPFMEENLEQIIHGLNSTTYLQYLGGEYFDERFGNIDYNNVTHDLNNLMHSNVTVILRSGIKLITSTEEILEKDAYVTFSGLLYIDWLAMYKCYGLEINANYQGQIKLIKFFFTDSFVGYPGILFHYPGQFLLSNQKHKWPYVKLSSVEFYITGMEVLKRRSKRKERCLEKWKDYDDLVLKRHIENHGCRLPYQEPYKQYPICSTENKIMESQYIPSMVRNNYDCLPCESLSKIEVEMDNEYDQRGNLY